MLEKYNNIQEFYKEPITEILKVLNSKNIFIENSETLREVTRLTNNKKLAVALGRYGTSANIYSSYISPYKRDKNIRASCIKSILQVITANKKKAIFNKVALRVVKNICKKAYKDAELIEEKNAIIIKHPELVIRNSKGLEHKLLDVYVKFRLESNNVVTAYITRGKYTYAELESDYSHSHYRRFFGNSWKKVSDFCLGINPLRNLLEDGAKSLVEIKLLINAVHELLVWESLEGGPYNYIKTVKEAACEIKSTEELVEYDINQLYIQALNYLKDKPGCLYSSYGEVAIDISYLTQFMRDSNDPRLYGTFVYKEHAVFFGEVIPKEYTIPPSYNGNIQIDDYLIPITVIPNNFDTEYTVSKEVNENIINSLYNKITKNLQNAVEYIYEPY